MSPDLVVVPAALAAAAALWGDQAEVLRRAARALDDVDAGALGARVAPLAGMSLQTWVARLGAVASASEGHGEAIRAAGRGVVSADDGVARGFGGAG